VTLPLEPWARWTGTPALAATFWTLHRQDRTAQCVLYTHASGWELCLQGEHSFPRAQVCRTAEKVIETREALKAELLRDGWLAHAQTGHGRRARAQAADDLRVSEDDAAFSEPMRAIVPHSEQRGELALKEALEEDLRQDRWW
jgi:hypothetical protein